MGSSFIAMDDVERNNVDRIPLRNLLLETAYLILLYADRKPLPKKGWIVGITVLLSSVDEASV